MLDADRLEKFLEKGIIEVAPLAFMRGRTLNDSFVILDEAQNTTSEQMKMFLTRLGFNSKAVITGDTTQIDLPQGKKSGLIEALEVCGKIEGIGVVQFGEKDVVRHNLVQQIIRAYEDYDVAHPQRGVNAAGGAGNGKAGAGTAAERSGKEQSKEQSNEQITKNSKHDREPAARRADCADGIGSVFAPGTGGAGGCRSRSDRLLCERCGNRGDE